MTLPVGVRVCGLVLAAGAGTRFGGPKGLARTADGQPWVARAVEVLHAGGCEHVFVAVGARAKAVRALVPDGATVVDVPRWADGVSAAVRAGLGEAAGHDAVVVTPVDVPELPAAAVRRVLEAAMPGPRRALVRAVYRGAPGHPVLLGADHLDAIRSTATGDRGAGGYLSTHGATTVECGDLWSGIDVDEQVRTRPTIEGC